MNAEWIVYGLTVFVGFYFAGLIWIASHNA
jgi:hypothetical protein